jgi:hypothetical protein
MFNSPYASISNGFTNISLRLVVWFDKLYLTSDFLMFHIGNRFTRLILPWSAKLLESMNRNETLYIVLNYV